MTASRFESYLHLRANSLPSSGSSEGDLVFLSNVTGTTQVWRLDEPMGWPEQVTFLDDRVSMLRHAPVGDRIAILSDIGGNERPGLSILSNRGDERVEISPPGAPHVFGGWSPDGTAVAFSHSHTNGKDFEVFVRDVGESESVRVWQNEGYAGVVAWCPDGENLLVSHARSNVDADLWRVHRVTGERERLTEPSEIPSMYTAICPHPAGTGFFLATEEGSDTRRIAFYDWASGSMRFVDPGPDGSDASAKSTSAQSTSAQWDVESLALSDDGRYLLAHRNVDGYTALELFDASSGDGALTSMTELPLPVPLGIAGGSRFVPGTHEVWSTWMASNDTPDVWRISLPSGDAVRWTRAATGGLSRDRFVTPETIRYQSFDGLEIPAFYSRPRSTPPGAAGYPVIVDIHGGPESQRRPTLSGVTQYFLDQGYAVLQPNVRGSRGYGLHYMSLDDREKRMDSVADIAAAHAWLVEHGEADPNQIAVMGGSYGGFMVLSSMVTYPDLWAAGIDVVGIANFVTFLENTSPFRRYLRESEFGSLEHDRELLERISPIHRVDQIRAPLMVIHGRNDPRVPVSEAEQLVEVMRTKELPVELLIYEDEGHGIGKRRNRLDAYPKIARFLAEAFQSSQVQDREA